MERFTSFPSSPHTFCLPETRRDDTFQIRVT